MRRTTRLLKALAVTAAGIGMTTLVAAPAQADTHLGGLASCGFVGQSVSITGQVGDTLRVQAVGTCSSVTSSTPGIVSWVIDGQPGQDPSAVPDMSFVTVTFVTLGETAFAMLGNGGLGKTFTVTVAPLDSGERAGTPLAVPVQQFAVAAGTDAKQCASLAPQWADWEALGPLRHDGWTVSWAQWPHDGAGGAVCTRQPAWTGSAWTVGD